VLGVAHRLRGFGVLLGEFWDPTAEERRDRSPGRLALFCGMLALGILAVNYEILHDMPILACISPDSWGYRSLNSLRTQGYQLFLNGVVLLLRDLRWAVPVQLNAMLLSYACIGFSVRRLFRSNLAGLAAALGLMLSAQLYEWYPQILTEALFIALAGVHVAAAIYLLSEFSDGWALVLGITVAMLILVRPNGVSFLLGILVLAMLMPRHWRRLLLVGIGPAIVAVLLQSTFNYYQQGFFGLTLFQGPQLVGKYGELITADMPTQYPELAADLEARLRPLYARYPAPDKRPFPLAFADISEDAVTPAQYVYAWPELTAYAERTMPESNSVARAAAVDRMGTIIALSAIAHSPAAFLREVGSSYAAYWVSRSLPIVEGVNQLAARCYDSSVAMVSDAPALYSSDMDLTVYQQAEVVRVIDALDPTRRRILEEPFWWFAQRLQMRHPTQGIAFLLSIVGLVALGSRRPLGRILGLWAYLGVTLHAGYLVLSLVNASFRRYAAPFDVVMMLMFITSAFVLWDLVAVRIGHRLAREVNPG
jgi:hypothetical protein